MRKKRAFSGDLQSYLNLDSLVDIISNNVGILVILAVFMAVFSLMDKREQVLSDEKPDKQIEKLEDQLLSKYSSVYDAVVDIATNNISVLGDLKLEKNVLPTIEEISSKIQVPSVEIRGILELSNNKSDGVEILRKILLDILKKNKENNVNISYLGAPKYRITVNSSDFKTAEKTLKPVLEEIEKYVNKTGGVFQFEREESKKTGEG